MHRRHIAFSPTPLNMLHLPVERLAALSDEPPTPEEEAHIASCESCARERRAYDALRTLASAERDAFGLPLTRWESIATALASTPLHVQQATAPRRSPRWMLQAAAGLLLVAGGAMLGRRSAGADFLQAPAAALTSGETGGTSSGNPDSVFFGTLEEARSAQQHSELLYQQATAYLARFDSTSAGTPVAYRSRLAALDRVLSTTREALRSAPHDPVINGYYLTTLGQREATLRQLSTVLPASLRVNSF